MENIFVAVAGIDRMAAANARFDLLRTIASACRPQQTPLQAMRAITSRLDADYAKIVAALALVEPSYTRTIAGADEKDIAENLILVGSFKGVPFILTHQLVPYLERGKILVKASGSMRNNMLKRNVIQYSFGGIFADVRAFVDDHTQELPTFNLVWAAHFLVDYQISKRPEASGYPIEVVETTAKRKVTWHYCDPECSEKQM